MDLNNDNKNTKLPDYKSSVVRLSGHLLLMLLCINIFAQSGSEKFKKENRFGIKIGTSINFINHQFYKDLNQGKQDDLYQPSNTSYFINPYASVGIEHHLLEHIVLQFNLGFYQTWQKYRYLPPNFTTHLSDDYVSNNVFMELLPGYLYKQTRFLAGAHVLRNSPTTSSFFYRRSNNPTSIAIGNSVYIQNRLEESYQVYSVIGIQQGIDFRSNELILSLTYFGLLKKYDTGTQLTVGYLF